jgi:hypothetical protein
MNNSKHEGLCVIPDFGDYSIMIMVLRLPFFMRSQPPEKGCRSFVSHPRMVLGHESNVPPSASNVALDTSP